MVIGGRSALLCNACACFASVCLAISVSRSAALQTWTVIYPVLPSLRYKAHDDPKLVRIAHQIQKEQIELLEYEGPNTHLTTIGSGRPRHPAAPIMQVTHLNSARNSSGVDNAVPPPLLLAVQMNQIGHANAERRAYEMFCARAILPPVWLSLRAPIPANIRHGAETMLQDERYKDHSVMFPHYRNCMLRTVRDMSTSVVSETESRN